MITVFLVRHGESQANAGFATPDPVKVELTSLGEKQANEVAIYLKVNTPLNLIVTSPYLRTKRTAEPTKLLFQTADVEEWEVQEFTYLSSINREYSTIQQRKPLVDVYWTMCEPSLKDGFHRYLMLNPLSESFKVFIWRVQAFIRKLNELDNRCQNIAVFSHEQFIAAVLWCLERRTGEITKDWMRDFRQFFYQNRIPNGGIVELKVRHNQVVGKSSVITSHLLPAIPGQEPIPKQEPVLAGIH